MIALRALVYFFEEALTSLWRSRLINALSVGTMAVSLFVLGAFLTVASNLNEVVARWTRKVQVTFYLDDKVEDRIRGMLVDRLKDHPAVDTVELVSREQALERFRALFHDLRSLPEDLGDNPFPAAIGGRGRAPGSAPAPARGSPAPPCLLQGGPSAGPPACHGCGPRPCRRGRR